MRKALLFLLFMSGVCHSQIVNVPDPGFKYNLIMNGVDANNDGNIQLSEALATTTLSLHHLVTDYIEDVTGLEAFVNLTSLEMSGWPSLEGTLDVTMMPNLTELYCGVDYLTQINVAGLTHLETLVCEFNPITSLDLTGCTSLKYLDCSDTGLTTLDLSQTPNLETFKSVYSNLTSVNFNAAPALKSIECEAALSNVDVSALVQLQVLKIPNNNITNLNLGTINNLTQLDCNNNELTTINVSAQTQLEYLMCGANHLTAIDVAPLVHLTQFDCSLNQITSLNVTTLTAIEILGCTNNLLTTLDLTGLDHLINLYISHNSIANINLTPAIGLRQFICDFNPLTSLDLSANVHLDYLYCVDTDVSALDLSMLPELNYLACGNSPLAAINLNGPGPSYINIYDAPSLTSLDLSNVGLLDTFSLGANSLSSVDFSNCPLLSNVNLAGNPNLTYVNLKNGYSNYMMVGIGDSPNLAYICANEIDIAAIQADHPQIPVNSYCTFVPGGAYNTINGTVLFDADANGCGAGDTIQPLVKIAINDGTNQGAAFLDSASAYRFYAGAGNFTLTPVFDEPSYFNVAAIPAVHFADANGANAVRDICITPNGIQPDVEVLIMQNRNARPGFDADYRVIYHNKGNQTVNGSVTVNFDDSRLDYVSAVPAVDLQTLNNLTWQYANLLPFETRAIDFKLNVNSPMEIPAVNDGDILDFTAALVYMVPDVTTNTISAELHQTVQNSLDPNDKTCLEGNQISPDMIGDYVHYNINFENIGSAPAQNIVVKDVIDMTKFDINTLQVMYASHPVATRVSGNIVEFVFENIELPGTSGDNKGNVVFKIKTRPNLVLGHSISNKAEIFFDYNFPIETNEATSTFALLKNREFTADSTIGIYPNPAKSKVGVKANSSIQSLQLFDVQGRLLQSASGNTNETSIDISAQQSGIYFLKIRTQKGSKVEKLVKE